MCDFGHHNHDAEGFGFLIDNPEIRELIHETRRITQTIPADADRVEALRPAFSKLLSADGWLPDACSRPDLSSKDRKSTRLNSSHVKISYAVFCLKKKNTKR